MVVIVMNQKAWDIINIIKASLVNDSMLSTGD